MKQEALVKASKPDLYEGDLPGDRLEYYLTKKVLAVDTETRGLNIRRDRLCLIQLCDCEGVVSLVRYRKKTTPNIKRLLEAPHLLKLFHFARFDVSVLKYYLEADTKPLWCTKIASKLVRTYTDKHGLKELGRELLGLELDKSDQTSDWAREDLSRSQLEYAANDVRVLIPIYEQLKHVLQREGLVDLAQRLFDFLPTVVELDQGGWKDVFEH